jgi:hypothetical protein
MLTHDATNHLKFVCSYYFLFIFVALASARLQDQQSLVSMFVFHFLETWQKAKPLR